jgi:hypothetical protein
MPSTTKSLPPPPNPPRRRGGQPGNANALKHGRCTREWRDLRAGVDAHVRRTYAMLDALGLFRSRHVARNRRGAPFGNCNALKHGRFSRHARTGGCGRAVPDERGSLQDTTWSSPAVLCQARDVEKGKGNPVSMHDGARRICAAPVRRVRHRPGRRERDQWGGVLPAEHARTPPSPARRCRFVAQTRLCTGPPRQMRSYFSGDVRGTRLPQRYRIVPASALRRAYPLRRSTRYRRAKPASFTSCVSGMTVWPRSASSSST